MRLAALAIVVIGCAGVSPAAAADVFSSQSSPYNPNSFSFDGFYVGGQGGVVLGGGGAGSLGVVAGANFSVADPVVAGFEFQGDWLFGGTSSTNYDFYALGRLGVVVTDGLLAYAEAGPGWTNTSSGYAFGGGAEYGLTDSLGLKGEVLGTGAWGGGPSAAKVQAGLLFHLQ